MENEALDLVGPTVKPTSSRWFGDILVQSNHEFEKDITFRTIGYYNLDMGFKTYNCQRKWFSKNGVL